MQFRYYKRKFVHREDKKIAATNIQTTSSLNVEDDTEAIAPPNSPDITDAENYNPHQHRNVPNPTS